MKTDKELIDLAARCIQDFEFVEAGKLIKLDYFQAEKVFIAAYKQGQSSHSPIKWPNDKQLIKEFQKGLDKDYGPDTGYAYQCGFEEGVEWLKSFVEKENQ